jgi:hypothetical protein
VILAEIFMPLLREQHLMFAYDADYARNLVRTKAPAFSDLQIAELNHCCAII